MKVKVQKVITRRSRQSVQLSAEVIQNAVAKGILQAEEQREASAKEKIKNTKLSHWTILRLIFFGVVAAFFLLIAIIAFVTYLEDISKAIAVAGQMSAVAAAYVMLVFADYALSKNKDKTFGFNLITVVIAVMSLLVAFFK